MWWRNALRIPLLVILLAGGASADSGSERDAVTLLKDRAVQLDKRAAELNTQRDRLRMWEADLTSRTEGERYFADLEGYVTARELLKAILTTSFVSVLMTLILLRLLEQKGIGRSGRVRAQRDFRQLESRVMSGLREVDHALTRAVDRIYKDVTGRRADAPADRAAPARERHPMSGAGNGAPSMRERVLGLAKEGRTLDEISRALDLGPAEISFILKTALGR